MAPVGRPLDQLEAGQALSAIVGNKHLAFDPQSQGADLMTVSPSTTEEVAAVVGVCRDLGLSIVPKGGMTGLVDGCISHPGQIAISMTRMNRIEAIYPQEGVAVVEAGVALESLQAACLLHDLEPGIDIPARGTATIGGMVSTNAGGIMAFRHGVMRHRVLGIEAVLPDGSIYSDLTRVVKNTAGYDLKHLFIGSEGTLGIVTRVALKLEPVDKSTATMMLGLPSVSAALDAISIALRSDVGHLRAAEGLWQSFIRLTARGFGWAEPDMPLDQPLFLLMTLGGPDQASLEESLADIFGHVLDLHPTTTGVAAASRKQEADLWRLREDTDLLYRSFAAAPSYDVSVPLSRMSDYVEHVRTGLEVLDGGISPFVFGHLADGNLHIVLDRSGPLSSAVSGKVERVLYDPLRALGGSFSAEHGIGAKRTASLLATSDPVKLYAMHLVKRAIDPRMLMNPGKVLALPSAGQEKP